MKLLPTEFTAKGYSYSQLSRDGDVAVYSQQWGDSGSIAYETVIVQRHYGREIAGTKIPPAEFMPSSAQWGIKGWTFLDRSQAFEKANALAQDLKTAVL